MGPRFGRCSVLVCLALGLALTACAAQSDAVQVSGAWARAARLDDATSGANSAVYLVLSNSSDTPDRLLKASSSVAKAVEIHQIVLEGDMMQMQLVTDGLETPAHGQVVFEPGGPHIMLIGLTRDLKPGDTVPLTLHFERGGTLTVDAEVRQP